MTYDEAAQLLSTATRWELRDHAFGDREVGWVKDGVEIAGGYFGGGGASIWFTTDDGSSAGGFSGDEARQLSRLGTLAEVSRNDETGPDAYSEGTTMPGLTLEGVREELLHDM